MNSQGFRPIFIVGNSRSGTTLVSNILGLNKEVYSFCEIHFFENMYISDAPDVLTEEQALALLGRLLGTAREGRFGYKVVEPYLAEAKEVLSNAFSENFTALDVYATFLDYEARRNGKSRPCEQTPRYIFYLEEILSKWPSARIIVMQRDSRDILLSQKSKWKQYRPSAETPNRREMIRAWSNYHPILLTQMWKKAMQAALKFKSDDRLLWIRFEDLIAQPDQQTKRICDFLGIEYDSSMLKVPASKSTLAKQDNVKEGISQAPVDRWREKLPAADLYWCQRVGGSTLIELGYQLADRSVSTGSKFLVAASLPIKAGMALMLNLSQSRSIFRSIKRRFL